jgi:hypothetical protein
VDAGSRQENASRQESGASVLLQSEPIMLQMRETANSEKMKAKVLEGKGS